MSDIVYVPQQFDENRYPGLTSTIHFNDRVLNRARRPSLAIHDPTPGITLEGEQKAARDDITDWILHPSVDDRVLTVGGLGGTGKTVLARHIEAYLDVLGIRHVVTSLTGSAVEVLRTKGVQDAQTIHSCLYTVDIEEKKRSGKLAFIKNLYLDKEIILVDEAQIMPAHAYRDFLSFPHVRIIAFGDHGQLRAISGDTLSLMDNPRIKLEEPRRQALESNILKFAYAVRQGKMLTYGKCPGVEVLPKRDFWKNIADPAYDQIIVGFNKTRHQVNQEVRKYRGYYGDIPRPGERVMCLYNHQDLDVYNGQLFIVQEAQVEPDDDELVRLTADSNGTLYTLTAIREQFGQNKLDLSASRKFYGRGYDRVVFMDYAYAISGHKAMGSEYASGKVLQEVHPDWDLKRWGYTSIIRFYEAIQYYR